MSMNLDQREAQIRAAMKDADLWTAQALAQDLADIQRQRSANAQRERELEFGARLVSDALTPVLVHGRHTTDTDWLSDQMFATASAPQIKAEANQWFSSLSAAVVADQFEFSEQANGAARRYASRFGEDMPKVLSAYLLHVAVLRKETVEEGQAPPVPGEVDPEQDGEAESSGPYDIGVRPEHMDYNWPDTPAKDAPSTRAPNVTGRRKGRGPTYTPGRKCNSCGRDTSSAYSSRDGLCRSCKDEQRESQGLGPTRESAKTVTGVGGRRYIGICGNDKCCQTFRDDGQSSCPHCGNEEGNTFQAYHGAEEDGPYPGPNKRKRHRGSITAEYHYIRERGGKYEIWQKGTGKTLSTHDTREQAESAFRAMESHMHGSRVAWRDDDFGEDDFMADFPRDIERGERREWDTPILGTRVYLIRPRSGSFSDGSDLQVEYDGKIIGWIDDGYGSYCAYQNGDMGGDCHSAESAQEALEGLVKEHLQGYTPYAEESSPHGSPHVPEARKHAIATEPNFHGSFVYDPKRVYDKGYEEGFSYALLWQPGKAIPPHFTSTVATGHKYNAEFVDGYVAGCTAGIAKLDSDAQDAFTAAVGRFQRVAEKGDTSMACARDEHGQCVGHPCDCFCHKGGGGMGRKERKGYGLESSGKTANDNTPEFSELDLEPAFQPEFEETPTDQPDQSPEGAADVANVATPSNGYPQPSSGEAEVPVGSTPTEKWTVQVVNSSRAEQFRGRVQRYRQTVDNGRG